MQDDGKSFEQILELLEKDDKNAMNGILNGLKNFIESELKQGKYPKKALAIYKDKKEKMAKKM